MIAEAERSGARKSPLCWQSDDGLLLHQAVPFSNPLVDPMLCELDLLPGSSHAVAEAAGDQVSPIADHTSSALESVRFEVSKSVPVICPPSPMRNVTVTRGSMTTLPLHLFDDANPPDRETVANFAQSCARIPLHLYWCPGLSAKAAISAATTGIHHPAQRTTGKKVASPGNQPNLLSRPRM